MGQSTAAEPKVTYVTLSADNDEVHAAFEGAIARVRGQLGRTWPLHVGGRTRVTAETTVSNSPSDTSVVVGRVSSASAEDVREAVTAAKAAFPAWRGTPWQVRADHLSRASALIRERRFDLATWAIFEMGKNRLEALGEVEELADLIDYYIGEMRAHDGYVKPMGSLSPSDTNTSVLRPYGVWGVISPWNFPFALLGAPIAAALLTGNTVVAKPSSETPITGLLLADIFDLCGLPPGVFSLLTGSGRVVGDTLTNHPDLGGVTFTGSFEVGFHKLYQRFATEYPRPCIAEMGGKNPAIVTESADLDRAAMGIYRSAFGMNGHKCSACSRVYVHESVATDLLDRLAAKTAQTKIGDPTLRDTFLGPLATRASFEDYQRFVERARAEGAIHTGGKVLTEAGEGRGYFAQPTILNGLPREHELMRTELFVPIVGVRTFRTLDQALDEANDTPFGLTAGLFSRKQPEIDAFLERIEAGVVYVNRAAGATTGAWPGVQPFGGWKGSGSSGKNIGGVYTLPCYLREQSRTVTA